VETANLTAMAVIHMRIKRVTLVVELDTSHPSVLPPSVVIVRTVANSVLIPPDMVSTVVPINITGTVVPATAIAEVVAWSQRTELTPFLSSLLPLRLHLSRETKTCW
jgi:hypothetical protein